MSECSSGSSAQKRKFNSPTMDDQPSNKVPVKFITTKRGLFRDIHRIYTESHLKEYPIMISATTPQKLDLIKINNIFKTLDLGIKYVKPVGNFYIKIFFSTRKHANNFILNRELLDKEKWNAHIPFDQIESQGIIRVPTDISEEDLLLNLKSSVEIIGVKRFSKKTSDETYTPLRTVLVTFLSTIRPDHVTYEYIWYDVQAYIKPLLQCYNCYKFHHGSRTCKNVQVCSYCSGPHNYKLCQNKDNLKCSNCSGSHVAVSYECPMKQSKISEIKNKIQGKQQTFASVVSGNSGKPIVIPPKNPPSEVVDPFTPAKTPHKRALFTEMDKVEIDPKLFVTCRLCVEDTGIYQIIPAVQAQIKYCFDIDVHSFDRLPQLICKKCEAILSDFYTKKKAFIEKQVKLKAYLCDKTKAIIAPQQDAVSSSQVDSEISSRVKDKENDGSLSDVSSSEDFESIPSGTGTTSSSIKIKTFAWKDKYRKVYKCRLCGKPFHHENFVKQHIKAEHDTLVKKYRKYVTKSCRVMLNKIDGKANITEENRILVLSQDQLLTHSRSALYHINYHLKKDEVLSDINSSDEEIIVTQKTYKRRRLLSRSSTETVVIERKKDSKTPLVSHDKEPISECINIDDSSDEESMSYVENIVGKSTDNAQITANNTETNDLGANEQNVINTKDIENIVNVCIGKYNKKNLTYVQDNTTLNQLSGDVLKHKLLSMGCKVLNKKVINCTGLLRYMEHNYDLDLIWKPVNSIACNYIKVRSNVSAPEKSDKNDWIDVEDIYISQEPSQEPKNELSRSEGHLQKLLNTHPVANPKKMPKKCDKEETMDQIVSDYFANELETISDSICMPIITSTTSLANGQTDSNPTDDTALPAANGAMPTDNSALPTDTSALPTDTSALPTDTCALPTDNCALYTDTSALPMDTSALPIDTSALPAKNNAQPGPLIKVKPVSELMADTPNNIWKLHSQANNMVTNKNQLVYVTPLSSSANSNIHAAPAPLASHHYLVPITSNESTPVEPPETPAPETTPPRDTVVLDTVHFPNTRTDSPFSYFKSLLLLYSINLIDSTSPLSRDYVSLIKFKLQFTQETNKPIVLSLALGLSCCGNNYCIKVRGRNQEAIDVSKMSANWQWEVLKSYKGNIVEKLLQNAQKYGQDTLTMTKKFICLLKSIHYITTKKGVTS